MCREEVGCPGPSIGWPGGRAGWPLGPGPPSRTHQPTALTPQHRLIHNLAAGTSEQRRSRPAPQAGATLSLFCYPGRCCNECGWGRTVYSPTARKGIVILTNTLPKLQLCVVLPALTLSLTLIVRCWGGGWWWWGGWTGPRSGLELDGDMALLRGHSNSQSMQDDILYRFTGLKRCVHYKKMYFYGFYIRE